MKDTIFSNRITMFGDEIMSGVIELEGRLTDSEQDAITDLKSLCDMILEIAAALDRFDMAKSIWSKYNK